MTEQARSRDRVTYAVTIATLIAWIVLLIDHGSGNVQAIASICSAARAGASAVSFDTLFAFNSLWSLVFGWLLMLAAMMLPTLTAPIFHVYERSFKRRRFRSVSMFTAGYSVVWLLVGLVMLAAQHALNALLPTSYWLTLTVCLAAFVWQCSPVKQLCLNRNHNHAELMAFGLAADLSALRFGITHALWCVGSCWALMLLPVLVSDSHLLLMFAVTVVMVGERLEPPRPLCWRVRGLSNLVRIATHAIGSRQFRSALRLR